VYSWLPICFCDRQRLCVPRPMYTILVEYRSKYSGEDKCYYILPFKMKKGSEYSMRQVETICEHYDAKVLNVNNTDDALFFKEAFSQSFAEKAMHPTELDHSNMAIIYLSSNNSKNDANTGWCNFLNIFLNGTTKFETLLCKSDKFGISKLTNSHICWRYNVMSDGESKIDKETAAERGKLTTLPVPTIVKRKKDKFEGVELTTAKIPSSHLKPVWKMVYSMGAGILAIYAVSALFLVYTTERRLYYERKLAIQLFSSKRHQ
uniref:Uncharacterized protein n=1 Tax=Parascaris univalens TaxID=6257 RepID=A0A915BIN1_PARUN